MDVNPALNERGEFREFLHIFLLEEGPLHVVTNCHFAVPWPMVGRVPDFELLAAHWQLNKHLKGWPAGWERFWWDLDHLRFRKRTINGDPDTCGPYWQVLPGFGVQTLAQAMAGIKRELRIQALHYAREVHHSYTAADERDVFEIHFQNLLRHRMERYLILNPQQEHISDEITRFSEGGPADLSERDSHPSNRPPRCW